MFLTSPRCAKKMHTTWADLTCVKTQQVQFVAGILLHINTIYSVQKAPLLDIILQKKNQSIPENRNILGSLVFMRIFNFSKKRISCTRWAPENPVSKSLLDTDYLTTYLEVVIEVATCWVLHGFSFLSSGGFWQWATVKMIGSNSHILHWVRPQMLGMKKLDQQNWGPSLNSQVVNQAALILRTFYQASNKTLGVKKWTQRIGRPCRS